MIDSSNKMVTLSDQTSLTSSALTIENKSLTTNSIDGLNNIISNIEIKNNNIRFKDTGNTATASYGVSLGLNTSVGSGSLATGRNSKALAFASAALGDGLVVPAHYAKGTTALGVFNDYDAENNPNVIFMVGNGSSDTARSNAFEVISTKDKKAIKVGNAELTESQVSAMSELELFSKVLDIHSVAGVFDEEPDSYDLNLVFCDNTTGYSSFSSYGSNIMLETGKNSWGTDIKARITLNESNVLIHGDWIDIIGIAARFNTEGFIIGETVLDETTFSNIKTLTTDMVYDYARWNIAPAIGFNKKTYFTEGLQMRGGALENYGEYGIKLSSNDSAISLDVEASVTSPGNIEISSTYGSVSITSSEAPVALNSNGIKIGETILNETDTSNLVGWSGNISYSTDDDDIRTYYMTAPLNFDNNTNQIVGAPNTLTIKSGGMSLILDSGGESAELVGNGSISLSSRWGEVSLTGNEVSIESTGENPVTVDSKGIKIGETTLNETTLVDLLALLSR